MQEQQAEIKKLLLDDQASTFVRNLMREVPVVDEKGRKMFKHASYSEVIATFITNPTYIENNRDLKRLEQSLELTMNKTVLPRSKEIIKADLKPVTALDEIIVELV